MRDVLQCQKCGKEYFGRLKIGKDVIRKGGKLFCSCGGKLLWATVKEKKNKEENKE